MTALKYAEGDYRRWRTESCSDGRGGGDGSPCGRQPKERRYELWVGETRAGVIEYLPEPGTILLVHTEVDPSFEGQGLGGRLVAGVLGDLRARGLKLVPLCPFVRAYLRRHPEDTDLVVGDPAVPQ